MKKKWLFVSGVLLLTGLCGRGPMVSLMKRAAAGDGGAVVVAGETGSEDRGEEVATKEAGAAADFGVRVKAERGEVDFGALHAFREWEGRYMAAGDEDRAGMVGEGVRLAAARRPAMERLIETNPRLALEVAVRAVVRQDLPEEVRE